MISNGFGLPITLTDSTSLSTPSHTFSLQNILCDPNIHKNIISISQFCKLNNTSIKFLSSSFFVKDLYMGEILLQGQTKDGVYEWSVSSKSSLLVAFSSVNTTSFEWHHRLRLLLSSILRYLVFYFNLELSSPLSLSFNSNARQCNKIHKLPFSILLSKLFFFYVWTLPIYSIDNFKYYVVFVDPFTKYIWFYPFKHKSQVHDVFIWFQQLSKNSLIENLSHYIVIMGRGMPRTFILSYSSGNLPPHFTITYSRT